MDAEQIRRLKPELTRYLERFDHCFTRRESRGHLPTYIQGQLSDLPAKSCEPIALAAGVAPRNLQEFLAHYRWDEDCMRQTLQQIVIRDHAGPNSIGVIDETSDVKKGDKTPGVQFLASRGATLNLKNKAGFTPLDLALGRGGRGGRGGVVRDSTAALPAAARRI
jgi:SRSO17 transposase